MIPTAYRDIRDELRAMYLEDTCPWLVGFSGGKDSTMLASLVFDAVLSVPPDQRKKPMAVLCTDTRVADYSESHRAVGLPGDLLNILKDDLEAHHYCRSATSRN
jgi:predicted phosphoadenosine phosphosulfate sulfurtransferase